MAEAGPLLPRTIGGYEVVRLLGSGGTADVFLCREPGQGALKAVKILARERIPPAGWGNAELRFQNEASCARNLPTDDPNLLAAEDQIWDEEGRRFGLVMRWVRDPTLRQRLARGPLDPHLAAYLAGRLCLVLTRIQELGVFHRDITPQNVFLIEHSGHLDLLLSDFGIAHAPGRTPVTEAHWVMATPGYAEPERYLGAGGAPAGEVFAVGALLFEMLTGVRAYPGGAVTYQQQLAAGLPDLGRLAGVAPALRTIVARALAADLTERFEDPLRLAEALSAFLPAHGEALAAAERLELALRATTLEQPVLGSAGAGPDGDAASRPPAGEGDRDETASAITVPQCGSATDPGAPAVVTPAVTQANAGLRGPEEATMSMSHGTAARVPFPDPGERAIPPPEEPGWIDLQATFAPDWPPAARATHAAVFYQPIVRFSTTNWDLGSARSQLRIAGYEALTRFGRRRDDGSMERVSYPDAIASLEGRVPRRLLCDLDAVLLSSAVHRFAAHVDSLTARMLYLFCNLAPTSFDNPHELVSFLGTLSSFPAKHPLLRVVFEIPEEDLGGGEAAFRARQEPSRGVEYALDDFGAKSANLLRLKAFDYNFIKLDGALVEHGQGIGPLKLALQGLVTGSQISTDGRPGVPFIVEQVREWQVARDWAQFYGATWFQGWFYSAELPLSAIRRDGDLVNPP